MPYNTKSDGDGLTASFVNANWRDQVISTVTSGTRPSGTEGQFIYETDTDKVYVYNGGWVQFGGSSSTATATHTPQIDQGASTNIAKTTSYSQYQQIGSLVWWSFTLSMTGSGSAGSQVTVTTPVTLASTSAILGNADFYDASTTTHYNGTVYAASSTSIRLFVDVTTNAAWGANPNVGLASGDVLRGVCWLPVA